MDGTTPHRDIAAGEFYFFEWLLTFMTDERILKAYPDITPEGKDGADCLSHGRG